MNRNHNYTVFFISSLAIATFLILTACGGGGGGGGGTPPGATGTISGTVIKGPVSGATVTAYAVTNGAKGNALASAMTDTLGNFSMSVGDVSGPVMLQMGGGAFIDEATGTTMTMGAGDVMTALIPEISTGATMTGIQVTPLTSMAQTMASGMVSGMTTTNITAANTAMGNFFNVSDILHTTPMDPLVPGSGAGATQDMRNYGMAIAAMSESAKSLGMTQSSGMVTLMMNDSSDGTMNGMMGSTPISMGGMGGMMGGGNMQPTAGTSGMATAMTTFINNTTVNKSGLTVADMQTLITKLATSNGQIQSGATGTISGTVIKGPVSGATVTAYAVTNGAKGNALASAMTDTLGNFSMSVGDVSGPVMLQMSSGAFIDEATGTTMTMGAGDVMTALIPEISTGATMTGIQMTPLTSMAQTMASGMVSGMTTTNITAANTAMGNFFNVSDILHTTPMDPLVPGSGAGATQDMRNYGMAIAAMSESAKSLGMTQSSGMVTLMMNDSSDGTMNGMMGSTPISMGGMGGMMGGGNMQPTAGTSGMATAMTTFINNTTVNKSGLTVADMQTLITKLNTSNGTIQ